MIGNFDPFREIPRPRVGLFSGVQAAPPGFVTVVDRERHGLRTIGAPQDALTAGEARFGRIRTIYQVDVREHTIPFSGKFPCRNGEGHFEAQAELVCQVAAPEAVIRRGLHDAVAALVPAVQESLRSICLGYGPGQRDEAERAALQDLRDREAQTPHDDAFRITRFTIALTLDQLTSEFVHALVRDQRAAALHGSAGTVERQAALEEAKLQQQQLDLKTELLAMERRLKEREAAYERQQLEFAQERERMETMHKAALRKQQLEIERQEHEFISAALRQDDLAYLVHQDPAQAWRAIQARHQRELASAQQRSDAIAQNIEAARMLMENGAAEWWQLKEQAVPLLLNLLESLQPPAPSIPRSAEHLALDSSDAAPADVQELSAEATIDVDATVEPEK